MTHFEEIRVRMQQVLEEHKSSKRALANGDSALERKIQRQISGKTKTLTTQTIIVFLDAYPEISAGWLMRGEGDMYIGVKVSDESERVCEVSDKYVVYNLFRQLRSKDEQIIEKDKQIAALQAENAKLLDITKININQSHFNDIKL